MHKKERGRRVLAAAVRIGGTLWRRRRWALALALIGPLAVTGSVELFVLNILGLGVGALFIRGQVQRRKEAREHRLWQERHAERNEWEYQRWLKRRDRAAKKNAG